MLVWPAGEERGCRPSRVPVLTPQPSGPLHLTPQTTKTLAEIQHSFIDLFNRNSDIRCSLRKRRKETWHRVSSIFRTPFLNGAAPAAGGASV